MFDLKISGGDVIDGSGRPRFKADIAIKDGKVAAIGRDLGEARETIDAKGRVVAPGFVDIHTHYDAQVLWDSRVSVSPWHGVTSCVIGNCGFGVAPTRPEHRMLVLRTLEKVEGMSLSALKSGLGAEWPFQSFPEYLDAVESRKPAINIGVLFGHTPVRLFVMGEDSVKRAATPKEVDTMAGLLREGLEAGAVGFATSHANTHNAFDGYPVPSRLAPIEEIERLASELGRAGRGVMQATIGRTLFCDQFEQIAKATGRPVTWTALLSGLMGPGSHRRILERTHAGQRDGLNVVPQVACRPIVFEFDFVEPFPFEARPLFRPTMSADRAGKEKIYRDAGFRAEMRADSKPDTRHPMSAWGSRTVISYFPNEPELEERLVADVAAERGMDSVDLALDLALASDLKARFRVALSNYEENDVAELLQDNNVVLGLSDAGAHANQLCDACYSTHLLGHWVREKKTLTLERAVEMLTRIPADLFGLSDRGRLAAGLPADVVVFDPATVAAGKPRRVHDLPGGADRLVVDAHGIDAVLCNGSIIRRDGKDVGTGNSGKLLRGSA